MFDLLDTLTLVCGGGVKAAATPAAAAVPKNEAEDSTPQEHDKNNDPAEATALEPVDAMDAKNYLVVNLSRPMGILFEENYDAQYDGAFVAEINEGCSAAADGSICRGDQVIAIGDKRVSGMDFDEVMKVIEESDTKIKLTLFRGPAESLYGPSGASKEWLDEFVAERGEEAALVEEESESEVMPDNADVAVSPALLDDVAVDAAAAAVDAYALGDTVEADQVLVDSESCDEKEADAALEVENEVDVDEEVECEAEVEKEVDESVGAVLIEDEVDADVQLAHETEVANEVEAAEDELVVESEVDMDEEVAGEAEVEKGFDGSEDLLVVENEVDMDEEVAGEAEVEKGFDTSEDVLVVENEVDIDEEVASEAEVKTEVDTAVENEVDMDEKDAGDAALEKDEAELVEEEAVDDEEVAGEAALEKEDASTLNGAVKKTSDDLLDTYYANTASQSVSDALAAVVEKENSTIAKSIFVEPRSPNGVEELKLESGPVDTKESFNDDKKTDGGTDEAVLIVDEADDDVEVADEAALEADDAAVTNTSKEWLDSYFANPESQLVSDDELDVADTPYEPRADLGTRFQEAAEAGTCTQ